MSLLVYALLSILFSLTVSATALQDGSMQEGTHIVLVIIERLAVFSHAIALLLLFGLTTEVSGPVSSRLRRCLAACPVGNSEEPITAFPRNASGFF